MRKTFTNKIEAVRSKWFAQTEKGKHTCSELGIPEKGIVLG